LILAVTPRHHLDGHAASLAIHSPHPVGEKRHDSPEGHELEPAFFQAVVGAATPTATRAIGLAVLPRPDFDHQSRPVVMFLEVSLSVHERLELLDPIEDRLDTHPGALLDRMKRGNFILIEACLRMRSFLLHFPRNRAVLVMDFLSARPSQ
jgi:hypothetical protein